MQTGNHEMILVIDFGGQYNQLIARRVRECGVYCEIVPYTYTLEQIKAKNPKGIIFTGGQGIAAFCSFTHFRSDRPWKHQRSRPILPG